MVTKKLSEKTTEKIGKITKETTLAEAMDKEGAEEVMAKHELPCLSCPFAKMEMEQLKIGDICERYGIDIDGLLEDLNKK
jgi:hypothetical protein